MGEIFLDDGDVRLYQGDVTDVLAGMPDESVDCVVTSPPYWGLRDYGTGLWDGGDPGCDHGAGHREKRLETTQRYFDGGAPRAGSSRDPLPLGDVCARCGARRVDQQLGLEPTPDLYVERIVAVFRQVRRVLAPHGTCWVNLGDLYAQQSGRKDADEGRESEFKSRGEDRGYAKGSNFANYGGRVGEARSTVVGGLKPKDLVGIPWRVAFALQADGWWLRADIVWAKPNPMPESVTDRPTKAHEYVFLLTKEPRYYFDQEAVREPAEYGFRPTRGGNIYDRVGNGASSPEKTPGVVTHGGDPSTGRNVRSVWQIATQPYPEAHFATYPEELVRRCVLAGCPERVCRVCGKPRERIVERGEIEADSPNYKPRGIDKGGMVKFNPAPNHHRSIHTSGWSDCEHNDWRPGTVLDPFIGSGTTCKVARDHGRHSIGIDLSADYLSLAARRLQQLSLLT